MTTPERVLLRTARATLMIGSARGIAVLWPILLTNRIGFDFYGRYTVVIAVSVLIAIPIDAYYVIRGPRADEEDFGRDQASRVWTGIALALLGAPAWALSPLAGFAVTKAGLDIVFNARKSEAIRYSRPDRALAEDAGRQSLSIVVCAVVLFAVHTHSMTAVGVSYVAGYAPFVLLAGATVAGVRPRLPERSRTTGFLIAEAVAGVAYLQGDIVLLGSLLSDREVGYYALATLVAQSAGQVGQSYAATFHDRLREQAGATTAAPPLRHVYLGAVLCAAAMLGVTGVLAASGAPHDLWLTFAVFAAVAAARFVSAVFTTVLVLQHQDLYRLLLSLACLVIKAAALLALGRHGPVGAGGAAGAALAFLLADLVFAVAPLRQLYRAPVPAVAAA